MRRLSRTTALVACILALPVVTLAQASITGLVKDASGAVLPGVTVEASSPALIEKTRSVVTDGSGLYRIENLRPGVYSIVFALTGFSSVTREGIELSGSFAATVNAELRVGTVQETVVVRGESPVVDVKSSSRQRVIDQELLVQIPTGRTQQTAATLIPGMTLNNQDVGGTNIINVTGGTLTIHGSSANDQRTTLDGLSIANGEGTGYSANMLPNMGAVQEVAVDYSTGSAEAVTGGVRMNMIPKEGGNRYSGSLFATGVTEGWQRSNYDTALQDRGLRTPNSLKMQYDINPGFGGPLVSDRLWFYAAARFTETHNYVGNLFRNKNEYNVNEWLYLPDPTRPATNDATERQGSLRLTWQASVLNKFGFSHENHWRCTCRITSPTVSQESALHITFPLNSFSQVSWTSPVTNKLLFEARVGLKRERYAYSPTPEGSIVFDLIPVRETAGIIPGLLYRGDGVQVDYQPFQTLFGRLVPFAFTGSYVTGSHAIKAGVTNSWLARDSNVGDNNFHLSYRFTNGTPNQITERATPLQRAERQPYDLGAFIQDTWTRDRLTLNYGTRFNYYRSYAMPGDLGPVPLAPTRNVHFDQSPIANWKDIVPRFGASYDLQGNGKTAIKLGIAKYVTARGLQESAPGGTGLGDNNSPINQTPLIITRNWADNNGNFYPDCDLTNPLAQGPAAAGALRTTDSCGIMSDVNFGTGVRTNLVDPDVLNGWATRPSQWEFSASVQREVAPRTSLDFGFFRRWYGNFAVIDNLAVPSSGYDQFSIVVPATPGCRTAEGTHSPVLRPQSGIQRSHPEPAQARGQLRQPNPALQWFRSDRQCETSERRHAVWRAEQWQDAQRQLRDHRGPPGSWSDRRGDVSPAIGLAHPGQAVRCVSHPPGRSAVERSVSKPSRTAAAGELHVTSAQAVGLGRTLNAGLASVPLFPQGTALGDRLNQLDLRVGKILRMGRARAHVNLDLYNTFNSNAVLAENANYVSSSNTGWRVPTTIVTASFAKISATFDF